MTSLKPIAVFSALALSAPIPMTHFPLREAAFAADKPSAEDLLRDADRARGGVASGITWDVEVESTEDKATSKRTFLVKAKGNDAVVETLAPPRNKGEVMLFNDRNIWFFKPGLKKPVAISARQKLSGQAANGDIASTNYVRDYDSTISGEEKVEGVDTYRLDLKAKAKNVTYDRIRYWISKDKRLGVKAEFLTLQGEVFKSATFQYENTFKSGGKAFEFVSRMSIRDASISENVSVVKYGQAKEESHPDSLFNINNVIR